MPSADEDKHFVSDLVEHRTPEGSAWSFTPDERGNVTERRDPEGNLATTTFDQHNHFQVSSETDEVGRRTELRDYDPNGLPGTRQDPRGGLWRYHYDQVGNVLSVTDANGAQTGLTYDAFDRLVEERIPKLREQGLTVTRRREYDPNGNLTSLIDATGAAWLRSYTPTDQVAQERSPGSGDRTFEYDAEDPSQGDPADGSSEEPDLGSPERNEGRLIEKWKRFLVHERNRFAAGA